MWVAKRLTLQPLPPDQGIKDEKQAVGSNKKAEAEAKAEE
jgi:hypothetical protein